MYSAQFWQTNDVHIGSTLIPRVAQKCAEVVVVLEVQEQNVPHVGLHASSLEAFTWESVVHRRVVTVGGIVLGPVAVLE
jgi:hypothetical protein